MEQNNSHSSRYEEKRKRMEKILEEKRKRILESQDKKNLVIAQKDNEDKARRIAILEEKVTSLEKSINQIKLDFSRYRARNTNKVKGKKE
jgi:hypothetical protein